MSLAGSVDSGIEVDIPADMPDVSALAAAEYIVTYQVLDWEQIVSANGSPMRETEAQFQSAVIDLARWSGWMVHHGRPAVDRSGKWSTPIQGDPGFPDLVLAHPARGVLLAELKSVQGRVSPAQREWAEALEPSGLWRLWRPGDWDQIVGVLTGPRS